MPSTTWLEKIGAIATVRGWVHPVTGELLKAQKGLQVEAEKVIEVVESTISSGLAATEEKITEVLSVLSTTEAVVEKPATEVKSKSKKASDKEAAPVETDTATEDKSE